MGFPSPTGPSLIAGRRPTRGAPLVQRAAESTRLPPEVLGAGVPCPAATEGGGQAGSCQSGAASPRQPSPVLGAGSPGCRSKFPCQAAPSPPSFESGELGCPRRFSRGLGCSGGVRWESAAEARFCLLPLWTCHRFRGVLSEVQSRRSGRRSWSAFSPFAAQCA